MGMKRVMYSSNETMPRHQSKGILLILSEKSVGVDE